MNTTEKYSRRITMRRMNIKMIMKKSKLKKRRTRSHKSSLLWRIKKCIMSRKLDF